MILNEFFSQPTLTVAKALVGKVIFRKYANFWLKVMIIETEAYMKEEKASHSSLGYTEKKKALFMPPGTIYMYYSRGKDSLNISTGKEGDAVLIKSGIPYITDHSSKDDIRMLDLMHKLNPGKQTNFLCSGQTLLAKTLNIKVTDWNTKQFDKEQFYIQDVDYSPEHIIQTTRLGIPLHRDAHLMYRFIDSNYVKFCTKNPITKKSNEGHEYIIL